MRLRRTALIGLLAATSVVAIAQPAAAQTPSETRRQSYNIPAGQLVPALQRFARQSRMQVIYSAADLRGRRTAGVRGEMTPAAALDQLVAGSGAQLVRDSSGAYLVRATPGSGEAQAAGAAADNEDTDAGATPEILVVGQRSQNVDIRRTEDDPQPYVVIGSEEIARSGASNVEELLRTRVPMNTQSYSPAQLEQNGANALEGRIDLRGLGASQTLVLVDGRRVAGVGVRAAAGFGQPLITGIPLSAIERVEILPSTSGGIYGGSATGGVVNIILKRDYQGIEIEGTYGNTSRFDAAERRLNASGGFSLEGGRTRVSVRASIERRDSLAVTERDLLERALRRQFANSPSLVTTPPPGITPNICSISTPTSTTCSTIPLVLDNGTSLGSSITSVPSGYPGPSSDGGAALVGTAGRYNFNPANIFTLLPEMSSYSIAFDLRRDFGENIQAFASYSQDGVATESRASFVTPVNLAATDPANPFQQNIRVSLPLPNFETRGDQAVRTRQGRIGIIARLPHNWAATMEYSLGDSRSTQNLVAGLNPTATATLQAVALRDPNTFPPDISAVGQFTQSIGPIVSELEIASLRVSGPVVRLPAGSLTVSALLEQRQENVDDSLIAPSSSPPSIIPAKSQRIRSAYAEARVPLVSDGMDVPFVHLLELTAAVRRDEYALTAPIGPNFYFLNAPSPQYLTQELASIDYTIALRYAPSEDIMLRGSLGTGFLPPNLGQLNPTSSNFSAAIARFFLDAARGNTPIPNAFVYITGGNPNLQPEQSRSISLGLILTPRVVRGLRVSVDYTRIRKTDEISSLGLGYYIGNPSSFAERVTRGPNLPGDAPGWLGPITQIDGTAVNVSTTLIEALDFQADYELNVGSLGIWRPWIIATRMEQLTRVLIPGSAPLQFVGFAGAAPKRWVASFGINWSLGRWRAGWSGQYLHSRFVYVPSATQASRDANILAQGSSRIPSQFYNDLYLSYRFGGGDSDGSGTEALLGIQNVFDQRPPTDVASISTGGYATEGDPRLRRFTATIRMHF